MLQFSQSRPNILTPYSQPQHCQYTVVIKPITCPSSYTQEAGALLERIIRPCYCQNKGIVPNASWAFGDIWQSGYQGLVGSVFAFHNVINIFSFQIKHLSSVIFFTFLKNHLSPTKICRYEFPFPRLLKSILHFILKSSPAMYFKLFHSMFCLFFIETALAQVTSHS